MNARYTAHCQLTDLLDAAESLRATRHQLHRNPELSFKEAATYMAPVQMLIIIPSALSMIPTIQLDRVTAWIPVVNVTLGLREVLTLGGKAAPWTELGITVGSSLLLAVLALKFCANRFSREDVLFRS